MSVLPFDESCEVILEAAGDQFGQFRYAHARALNGNGHATIVLSFCLNMLRMKLYNSHDKKRLQKDDQWFPCPAVDIEDKLGMGRDRRRVAIKNLVKAGFIEVDNRAGNETWCRIDTGKIRDLGQKSGNRPSRSRETAPPIC